MKKIFNIVQKEDCLALLNERAGYYLSLVSRLFSLRKKDSIKIILFTIITQILSLASFLIPIKMIIILAKQELPEISLIVYDITSKEDLILFFLVVMILVLAIRQIIRKIISVTKKISSNEICTENKYLEKYPNQENLAYSIFNKYITSLSGFIFVFIILAFLFILKPLAALALVTFWIAALFLFIVVYNNSERIQKVVKEDLRKVTDMLGALSLLAVFIAIAIDLTSNITPTELQISVISLIIVRFTMAYISTHILSIKHLFDKRDQIESIFFYNYVHDQYRLIKNKQSKFLNFFDGVRHKQLIEECLSKILNKNVSIKCFDFYELAQPDVMAFLLTIEKHEKYLIKVFNSNLHKSALKEGFLLSESCSSNLTLSFVGTDTIGDYLSHFYKYKDENIIRQEDIQKTRLVILEKIAKYDISQNILDKYAEDYKYIYERCSQKDFNQLRTFSNSKDLVTINWFEKNWECIQSLIRKLPLRLVIPNINKNILLKDCNDDIRLIGFNDWKIEPIGFSFNFEGKDMELLKNILDEKQFVSAKIVQLLEDYESNIKRNGLKKCLKNLFEIKTIYNQWFK